MSTATVPTTKNCDRCGMPIIWNNGNKFFESIEFPGYKHCCKKPCNKAGCGGTIYFSNICPKNPETGNARPLDVPIPVVDQNNPAQKIWVVHVHKNNVAATDVPTQENTKPTFAPAPATVVPETKPLAQGQDTLVFTETQSVPQVEQRARPELIAEVANKDVSATLIQGINDIGQRLGELERLTNEELVPIIKELNQALDAVLPKLQIIVGEIAKGSIKSASDLVEHNLNEREEKNLQ